MHILIADDDDIARELLRNTLKQEGYKVTTARDGREALKLLHAKRINMVISDWVMPELDGVDLCRTVRGGTFPQDRAAEMEQFGGTAPPGRGEFPGSLHQPLLRHKASEILFVQAPA